MREEFYDDKTEPIIELYAFLEAGDVIADSGYEVEALPAANHDLGKFYIALDIAVRI